jgi:hypothetical protein
MPPGSESTLAELGEERHTHVLTIEEVEDTAADLSAADSLDAWLAAVQRSQQTLACLRSHCTAVVTQSPVAGMWQTVTESTWLINPEIYTLAEKTLITDVLCTALAKGLQLLCADDASRQLLVMEETSTAAAAAWESISLLVILIEASANDFFVEFGNAEPREALLPTGALTHAGGLRWSVCQAYDYKHTEELLTLTS